MTGISEGRVRRWCLTDITLVYLMHLGLDLSFIAGVITVRLLLWTSGPPQDVGHPFSASGGNVTKAQTGVLLLGLPHIDGT